MKRKFLAILLAAVMICMPFAALSAGAVYLAPVF